MPTFRELIEKMLPLSVCPLCHKWITVDKEELKALKTLPKICKSCSDKKLKEESWASDKKSVERFEKTIGKSASEHGYFDKCVKRMEKHLGDGAEGFCAKTIDTKKGTTKWRGKRKKKENVKKDQDD